MELGFGDSTELIELSVDSGVVKFSSLITDIVAYFGKMSTQNDFCLVQYYVLKDHYDEVQNR